MDGLDTIKSHMVSLGFGVDQASYKDTEKAVSALENMLTKFASHAIFEFSKAALAVLGLESAIKKVKFPKVPHESTSAGLSGSGSSSPSAVTPPTAPLKNFAQKAVKYFGEASAAVTTFATVVVGATAGVLNSLGNQEIQMEMLSRQLWTTQTQAMAFSLSLKALGANLQELYLSPTLMAQYQKLHAVALQMQTPGDYNSQIKQVQNISLAFAQMQLEANYSLQWIGYYFIKYMSGPISKVNQVLNNINNTIVKGMPVWTKQVAAVMQSFMQAGVYIIQALGGIWSWLVKMFNYMPGWAKGIAAAIAMLTIVMDANPFGQFMLALSAVILLFDDFETYVHGGKSALAPFWKAIQTTIGWFHQFSAIGDIILGVAATWGVYTVGMKAWNAATAIGETIANGLRVAILALGIATEDGVAGQLALNAAMDANPVGIIITSIGLLVGVLIILATHWKQVEKIAVDAWSAIVYGAKKVWSWFAHLGIGAQALIAAILPFVGIPALIMAHWGQIRNFFSTLWSDVKNSGLSAWNTILTVASTVWKGIQNGFSNAINFVISMFDNVIKMIDRIPGVKIPLIPLAQFGANASTATGYVYPQGSSTSSTYTTHVTVNNTIHGATDPNKTAAAIHHTFNKALHNVRGVIG
jgi:hypothetical protein